jgi:hypothetical protein
MYQILEKQCRGGDHVDTSRVEIRSPGQRDLLKLDFTETARQMQKQAPHDINSNTPDWRISGLVCVYETEARSLGFSYDERLYSLLISYRDALKMPRQSKLVSNVVAIFDR